MSRVLDGLRVPIIQAPLSGGASTPALTIAALQSGAFGFLAAGYLTADKLAAEIEIVRGSSEAPFGINMFVPAPNSVDDGALRSYAERIRAEASAVGAALGEPRWSDDDWTAKLDVIRRERPAVVSFTFGCPDARVISELRELGIEVWITVTEPGEAELAAANGADALVLQGAEAGGHRASFVDEEGGGEIGSLALIRLVAKRVDLPLVAAGGMADGRGLAAALVAGARAVQVGSALLDTLEAGTSMPHREALRSGERTSLTRAFTGRRARGIVNGFMRRNSASAPAAYPHVHYLTAPMRAAARAAGNRDLVNLWAGQGYELIDHQVSASAVIARLVRELAETLGFGGSSADGKVWVFFYGSYMNFDVLKRSDVLPAEWEVVRAPGFELRIGPRANLVRAEGGVVWGVNVRAGRDEISRLYTGPAAAALGETTYLPEAIVTITAQGQVCPATTYISPSMVPGHPDAGYVQRIAEAARRFGFPQWYLAHIEQAAA